MAKDWRNAREIWGKSFKELEGAHEGHLRSKYQTQTSEFDRIVGDYHRVVINPYDYYRTYFPERRFRLAGPAARFRNARDGTVLVHINGGSFHSGEPTHPSRRGVVIDLQPFYLAAHPVANAQYGRFVAATGHPPEEQLLAGRRQKRPSCNKCVLGRC